MRWRAGWLQQNMREARARREKLLFDLRGFRRHRSPSLCESFGVGAAWRPVLGRKGNPPEARVRVDKFNPNFRYLQLPRGEVHHRTYEFFASRHMFMFRSCPTTTGSCKRIKAPWAFTTWVVVRSLNGEPLACFPDTTTRTQRRIRWLRR